MGLLFLLVNSIFAQQEAQYSQYMYNTISVNPAYAGSRNVLSVLALHRSQWVGFEGAPTTQFVSIHAPIARKRIGVGVFSIPIPILFVYQRIVFNDNEC